MAAEQRQPALARAANAMLRALGGGVVKLRMAVASTAGTQRELGIAPSSYQEVEVTPVIVRELNAKDSNVRGPQAQIEVLISSSVLDNVLPGFGVTKGREFLTGVRQVVYGSMVFSVTEVSEDSFAGVAYMYHVTAVRGE